MATGNFKIESGVQLLARLRKETYMNDFYPMLFDSGLKSGDFVEITYDGCTSPFLIDLIAEALMYTGACASTIGVLIFNTDGNIDYGELVSVLENKLRSNCNPDSIEIKLKNMLAHMHILDIYDANQFLCSIHNLESILTKYPYISIIFFHSLTAFYWSEQGFKITKMDHYIKNLINTIQKVIKEYKTICFYTKPEYFSSNNKDTDLIPLEVDYNIQSLDLGKGNYQINIKTTRTTTSRYYIVINKHLQWTTF